MGVGALEWMEHKYKEGGRQEKMEDFFEITLASRRGQFVSHVKLLLFVPVGARNSNPPFTLPLSLSAALPGSCTPYLWLAW